MSVKRGKSSYEQVNASSIIFSAMSTVLHLGIDKLLCLNA